MGATTWSANGATRSTSVRAAVAIAGRRGGVEEVRHARQPSDVVREVEAGRGLGGEPLAGFVDASELAEHARDGGAQRGDGRVVAGDVDEEVGDLVESALVPADDVEDAAVGAERVRARRPRCRAPALARWPPRPRRRARRAAAGRSSSSRELPALVRQPDLLGDALQLGRARRRPRRCRTADSGPRPGGTDCGPAARGRRSGRPSSTARSMSSIVLVEAIGRRERIVRGVDHLDERRVVAARRARRRAPRARGRGASAIRPRRRARRRARRGAGRGSGSDRCRRGRARPRRRAWRRRRRQRARPCEKPSAAWTRTSVSSSSLGERGRLEQRLAVLRVRRPGVARCRASASSCAALVLVGCRLLGDEVEGLLVPADGVVGRERVAGGVAGAADVVERLVEVGGSGGGDPVVGELGERRGVLGWSLGFRGLRRCAGGRVDGGSG